jgi:hypothetical protein
VRRRGMLVFPAAVLIAVATATASGSPAADDVSVGIQVYRGANYTQPTTTVGPRFKLGVGIDTSTGVAQTVTVRIGLPGGLRWGLDGPDPGEGCTGTAPAVCTQELSSNGAGTIEGGYVWDVIADRLGTYEVTATVEPTQPDPNLANNAATQRFEVVADGSQGGGGNAARVGAVKLSPAKPRAGSTVVAAVRVTKGGSPLTPTHVRCSASIGSAKVKGTGRAASGVASCLFKTPKSGKGKTLAGSVSFSAGGSSISKRFAVKLH